MKPLLFFTVLAPFVKSCVSWPFWLPSIRKHKRGTWWLEKRVVVNLVKQTHVGPLRMASHDYSTCKQAIPPVFFVLGGPGSGKGTQCKMLARSLGLKQICVGELLRREAKQPTAIGKLIASIIDAGNIVPGYITLRLLADVMERERMVGTKAILMDGFPRALEQAIGFEEQIGYCQAVIYFSCSVAVLKKRLLTRGLSSGRIDDVEPVIMHRLETFERETLPVTNYYKEKGKIHCFDAEQAPNLIHQQVDRLLKTILVCATMMHPIS